MERTWLHDLPSVGLDEEGPRSSGSSDSDTTPRTDEGAPSPDQVVVEDNVKKKKRRVAAACSVCRHLRMACDGWVPFWAGVTPAVVYD